MCKGIIFLSSFVFIFVVLPDIVRSHVHDIDSEKACELTHCNDTEHCVNRKFWCKNPPCPRMIYCSKTRKESLKGPTTCESVRCSRGYVCHVKVRRCHWDQKCELQIARCVSELDYSNEPASCADFKCSSGYQCILKESLCSHPPCKLLKSCAKEKDVEIWHSRCRTLGCPSEYECFLRRPEDNCASTNSCKHTPDCTLTNGEQHPTDSYCSGWVCPRHQECSALTPEYCDSNDGCKVNRTCTKSLAIPKRTSSPSSPRLIPRVPTSITNIRGHEPQTENSRTSQIATQPDDRESNHHSALSTTQSTSSASDCDITNSTVHRGHHMLRSDSIYYLTPVYFRSTVNRKSVEAPRKLEQPVDPSIIQWLEDLRLKTGVDAISVWAKHAEQNMKYEQFIEWLTAVETTLGPIRFEIWLDEIRKLTTNLPAFQKWLPVSRSTERDIHNGNSTQQDIPKVLSEPQSQAQQDGHVDSSGTLSPKGNGNSHDKLTKSIPDVGQQTEKRWAWRYEKPGNVQKWPGQPQSFETPNAKIETTTIIPKQSKKGVPIDVTGLAQFGRELDLYPLLRSGYDQALLSVDGKSSEKLPRKNAGHPRINYGRSPAAELRNGPQTHDSTDQLHKNDKSDPKIRNVTSLEDPNVLSDKSKNPKGNINDQKPEEDQKKFPKGMETPKSDENEGVRDTDHQDLKKNDKTNTYNVATDELAPRMFDDEKIAYYTLLEFLPGEVNEELQLAGYPLTISKTASIPDGPYATLPPMTHYSDQTTFQNRKQEIDSRVRPTWLQHNSDLPSGERAKGQKDFSGNRLEPWYSLVAPTRQLPRVVLIDGTLEPIERFIESHWIPRDSEESIPRRQENDFEQQSPFDDLYEWSGRLPEGFGDYPGSLTSQEYVDVYVDALIEDALSEMILRKHVEEDKSPADFIKISKDFGSNSRHSDASTDQGSDVGIVQQTTTTSNPASDDQPKCGKNEMNPSPTKSLLVGEGYGYPVDKEQEEYFERFFKYQDEYLGDLGIDLTNYDFQYYYDDDKVILTKNDGVDKL